MTRAPRKIAASPPAKIADVARLAGVSVATVSRALANPGVVTEDTRRKVIAAVREAGYTPNGAARSLRVRKSMMALVVVPDIANIFFAEVLRGIDDALSAAGYGMIIGNLDNSRAKETRYVDLVLAGQVDGVLLMCGHVIGNSIGQGARSLNDVHVPIVAVCERIPGVSFPQVEIDNRAAARIAVDHLVALGHRRIGYISGPAANILDVERKAGYFDSLASHGLKADKRWMCEGNFTFASGAAAARKILALPEKNRPNAFFAANDEMAAGFVRTVQDMGLSVPGDFSIAGFDGGAHADFCQPALTTLIQPRRELGARAAEILTRMMQGENVPGNITRLGAELRIAGSAASLK